MGNDRLGLYRASVLDNDDPTGTHRLQVLIPTVSDRTPSWATACVPGTDVHTPDIGDTVWVMFEGGDIHLPVRVGMLPRPQT